VVLRPRREVERLVGDVGQERGGRHRPSRIVGELVDELPAHGELGQPGGVLQRLAQRHLPPRRRELGQALGDRVVERELAALDERERRGAVERLGDAGDAPGVVGLDLRVGVEVGLALVEDLGLRPALHLRVGAGRALRRGDQGAQPAVQCGVGRSERADAWAAAAPTKSTKDAIAAPFHPWSTRTSGTLANGRR